MESQEQVAQRKRERIAEDRWCLWSKSTSHILEFLELGEVLNCAQLSRDWKRVTERFIRDCRPSSFSDAELKWIDQQVKLNGSFPENSINSALARVLVQPWRDIKDKVQVEDKMQDSEEEEKIAQDASTKLLSKEAFLSLADVQELVEKIHNHTGHYCTYPPLAIELLSEFGTMNKTAQNHELLFKCKDSRRKNLLASGEFLYCAYLSASKLFQVLEPGLSSARENLIITAETRARLEGESFVDSGYTADGRSISVHGILAIDLTKGLLEYQEFVAATCEKLQKQAREGAKNAVTKVVKDLTKPVGLGGGKRLELKSSDAFHNECCTFFQASHKQLAKYISKAFMENVLNEQSAAGKLEGAILHQVEACIDTRNPERRIDLPYFDLLGVLNPAVLEQEEKEDKYAAGQGLLGSHAQSLCSAFLKQRYPSLSNHVALRSVEAQVDRFLDYFLDPPDNLEHDQRNEKVQGLAKTPDELRAKPVGWLTKHLVEVYKTSEQEEGMEEESLSAESVQSLKDFALRRYIHHAGMKENVNRALSFAPKGSIVLPQDRRGEHIRRLADALCYGLCRDFGPLENAPPGAEEFWYRVSNDPEFLQTVLSMSLKSLAETQQENRRQMKEFEAARRKSDSID